ncbi:MAG: hypothetical protein RSD12_05645 [Akkermansia sp.]
MWSKITIAAVILMLAAGVFAYQNMGALKQETAVRDQAQTELDTTNSYVSSTEQKLAEATQKKNTYKADSDALSQELLALQESNTKLDADIAPKVEELTTVTNQLADLNKKFEGKNLSDIAGEIESLKKENAGMTEDLANKKSRQESLTVRSEQLVKGAADLNKLAADQRARISPPTLNTSVRNVYDTWGFLVLNGGANAGIVLGSRLAVMRGDTKVAELNVSNVEPNKAAADVIPLTLVEGERIIPGDRVVAVRPE